jgi:hypothetical protein
MGWVSDRWRAFSAAAGPRRYVMGAIISVVIALSDHLWAVLGNTSMTALVGIPSWGIGLVVALCLVNYWLLEYLVDLRRRIGGARHELARLRTAGVVIRNEGMSITNVDAWKDWEKRASTWNDDVIASIKKINEADAEWFSILDVVPEARLPISATLPLDLRVSAAHHKLYREHDFRLKRLAE